MDIELIPSFCVLADRALSSGPNCDSVFESDTDPRLGFDRCLAFNPMVPFSILVPLSNLIPVPPLVPIPVALSILIPVPHSCSQHRSGPAYYLDSSTEYRRI
ncbi:hypothetical protein EVAR_94405_1 [Eumeta japonica]|uniref:Uncharacterized protein n=1 Tax=Eumeta variegata TaxID=151549 RepID=A0A4C1TQ13_EUMVA|nr:hypothetical protein EVAR_94405_1 [Eumeta japonica]